MLLGLSSCPSSCHLTNRSRGSFRVFVWQIERHYYLLAVKRNCFSFDKISLVPGERRLTAHQDKTTHGNTEYRSPLVYKHMLSLVITLLPGFSFRLCPRLVQKQALHFLKSNLDLVLFGAENIEKISTGPLFELPMRCGHNLCLKYNMWFSWWNYVWRNEKHWKEDAVFSYL